MDKMSALPAPLLVLVRDYLASHSDRMQAELLLEGAGELGIATDDKQLAIACLLTLPRCTVRRASRFKRYAVLYHRDACDGLMRAPEDAVAHQIACDGNGSSSLYCYNCCQLLAPGVCDCDACEELLFSCCDLPRSPRCVAHIELPACPWCGEPLSDD